MILRISLLTSLLVILGGCVYSFVGGGLPGYIDTVAVLPFENTTAQPLLETEVETQMQDQIPSDLGVRLAAEDVADAVVRGRITGYEEVPASVRPTPGNSNEIPVLQREVRINFEAEIYDMRQDKALWTGRGQSVTGIFQPDTERPEVGRTRAIQELVRNIVEGAQSQW